MKIARIGRVEFLNWQCKHTILCKRSEYRKNDRGGFSVHRESSPQSIENPAELRKVLVELMWKNAGLSSHIYERVFVKKFESGWAAIGYRRNGIDFQLYDLGWEGDLSAGPVRFPDGSHNLVRHSFYASEIDLFEFSKEFALNAHLPFEELGTYFESRGKKQSKPKRQRDDLSDIRQVLGDAMTDTESGIFG